MKDKVEWREPRYTEQKLEEISRQEGRDVPQEFEGYRGTLFFIATEDWWSEDHQRHLRVTWGYVREDDSQEIKKLLLTLLTFV